MQDHQIEFWVLNIIERIQNQQPIEDTRVELKRIWINPQKAARQIAGHANAARGANLLWVIGVDEVQGVVGVNFTEFSSWYSQVNSFFDGLAPEVRELNIPVENCTVVALYFETNRAPFVGKNPKYGSKNGGPVSLEVPWRENTSTRSARRSESNKNSLAYPKNAEVSCFGWRVSSKTKNLYRRGLRCYFENDSLR